MSRAGANSLPAKPLADAVDRVLQRAMAGLSDDSSRRAAIYTRLGVHERRLLEWRTRPAAFVTREVADRVLSKSPYLWFDVWPECTTHARPVKDCLTCLGYYRARAIFTSGTLPRVYQATPKPKPRAKVKALEPVRLRTRAPRPDCVNEHCGDELPRGARAYCADCRTVIAEVRQTLTEGMWADDWALTEIADVLGVGVAYFAGRRLRSGWDLPYRYERHATAVAA